MGKSLSGTNFRTAGRLVKGYRVECIRCPTGVLRFVSQRDVEPSTELGVGRQYVAGRNVEPGTYKLSSNVSLNKEYVEWRIEIVNLVTEDRRSQTLSGSDADVAIRLEEGEIISTDFSNHYEFEKPTGETRLILTSVN